MCVLLALLACGGEEEPEPCAPGFGLAEDGNCYLLSTGDDDDDVVSTDGHPTDRTDHTHSGDHTTGGCETTFSGPVTVVAASVECDGADRVRYDVETEGWCSGGYLYQIETGTAQPWADEHDLESYAYDPCGLWDKLGLELETAVSLADWDRNEATLFTCPDHFEGGVMTYAAAAIDLYGQVADCLAWGDDPGGVIDGSVLSPYNYESGPSFDPSICVIGIPAR